MTRVHCQPAILLAVALGGCARMEPGLGFDEVRQDVAERTRMRIHWDSGSEADREVEAAIDQLLGRELAADEAVQIALLNNRELQAIYEELDLAQADLVQAGLLRNPVFSGEVRFSTGGGGTGIVLDATQDFLSLFYLPLRRGRAAAAFEAAKLRVTGAVVDMAGEVRAAFYEYQASEQTLEMRRGVVDAMEASYELAQRLHAAGNNRDLDVARERDRYEQARVQAAEAEETAVQGRERLNALMGLWGQRTQWRAGARLPDVPEKEPEVPELERRAVEASLDLGIARREIEIAARSLGISRPFGWLTDVEVGVAAERETEGGWSVGPSVSFPVPLLDQGQASVGRARAQLRQAQAHYYARAVEVRSRARAAASAVSSARDRAQHYERVILPLRQSIVEQTQLQYNAMQVSAFELLQAKRDQIDGGAAYIDALRDYWVARARLDEILGGRTEELEKKGAKVAGSIPHTGLGEQQIRPLQHRHTGARPVATPE